MNKKSVKSKKSVLGRGLGNLLESSKEMEQFKKESGIVNIKIEKIRVNPDNPRKKFNQAALKELEATVKEFGLLQPILVKKIKNNEYQVISGERRLRACRNLKLKEVAAIIKTFDAKTSLQVALIENIQREQLDIIEEAEAYKKILSEDKMTQEELSLKVGKNRSTISNRVRLLKLPSDIQAHIADGRLTEGQARPLLSLDSQGVQSKLCNRILENNLSARQSEELVKTFGVSRNKSKVKKVIHKSSEIRKIEEKIEALMKCRALVEFNPKKKKGKILLEFFSIDEFEYILKAIGIKNKN